MKPNNPIPKIELKRNSDNFFKFIKRIAEYLSNMISKFPNAVLGLVFGIIIGFIISFIPIIGPLLSKFLTPLAMAIGLIKGILEDIKDRDLTRKVKNLYRGN